jgi:hypothetical protein
MQENPAQAAPAPALAGAPAAENPVQAAPAPDQPAKRGPGRPRKQPGDPKSPYRRRPVRPSKLSSEPLTPTELPVPRDAQGHWLPGHSGGGNGLKREQLRVKRMLEDATPRAIGRLVRALDDPDAKVAVDAATFIVGRVAAPPRNPSAAVQINNFNSGGHMAAVLAQAERRMAESNGGMLPAPNPAVHVMIDGKDDEDVLDVEAEDVTDEQ